MTQAFPIVHQGHRFEVELWIKWDSYTNTDEIALGHIYPAYNEYTYGSPIEDWIEQRPDGLKVLDEMRALAEAQYRRQG